MNAYTSTHTEIYDFLLPYQFIYFFYCKNRIEFSQQFRRKFKGMNIDYVRSAFKRMSKNYNYPLFKKFLSSTAIENGHQSSKCVWQFTIPSGATLSVKGSLKAKYSFNVSLVIVHSDKTR